MRGGAEISERGASHSGAHHAATEGAGHGATVDVESGEHVVYAVPKLCDSCGILKRQKKASSASTTPPHDDLQAV